MNRGTFLALVFLFSSIQSADGAPLLRTVALSGQQAPGTPSGAVFTNFYIPDINDYGLVAFQGSLEANVGGVTTSSDQGVWSEGTGSLQLVAREGSQAAGVQANARYGNVFSVPSLSNSGQVVFSSELQTGSGGVVANNNSAIWAERAGSLEVVAREGSQAPGVPPGHNFGNVFGGTLQNNSGLIAFASGLQSAPSGIWSEGSGSLGLIVQTGQLAPNTGGAVFSDVGVDNELHMNDDGAIAFKGRLQEGTAGVDAFNNLGIWSNRNGSLELVVRTAAQGAPDLSVQSIESLAFSNSGSIAFNAFLTGDVPSDGIFLDTAGSLSLIARSGTQAPDTPPGAVFLNLMDNSHIALNSSGKIAFTAYLKTGSGGVTGFNSHGLWSDAGGSLSLVSRAGDVVPGTPNNARIFEHDVFTMNDRGQVAFSATLDDGGYGGLFATDVTGELKVIALQGAELEIAPGDFRTVQGLRFFASGESLSGFNNRGQLAFYADFTDGSSGIFVSNVAAIPEPSAVVLLALAIAGNFVRCSR
jgi:hypothetical protein